MIVPAIMAGGSGTRLWPLSRALHPKQLLPLTGPATLLEATAARILKCPATTPPVVICNEKQRFMVAEQLNRIGCRPSALVLEPVGRNTAPAIAVAALLQAQKPDAVLLVLPADHYIANEAAFIQAVRQGWQLAEAGYLITFGVVPRSPETGYGYILQGEALSFADGDTRDRAFAIQRFVEKPDPDTARTYLEAGTYSWNSGIFMFKAARVLEELEQHAPEIVKACRAAVDAGKQDLDFFRLDKQAFTACPADSIDYAVMEHTHHGVVIPFEAGWSDVGAWEALWQIGEKDACRNVIQGDVLLHEVHDSLVYATRRLVTAVGLEAHVIIETADAVLVAPRHRVQDVKYIVGQLQQKQRREALSHPQSFRPWGTLECIHNTSHFKVNRISVKPGSAISRQQHYHRAEHWIVVHGTAQITRGEETFLLAADASAYIPSGTPHRLKNPGKITLEVIEVQTGSYLGEDDIIRLDGEN